MDDDFFNCLDDEFFRCIEEESAYSPESESESESVAMSEPNDDLMKEVDEIYDQYLELNMEEIYDDVSRYHRTLQSISDPAQLRKMAMTSELEMMAIALRLRMTRDAARSVVEKVIRTLARDPQIIDGTPYHRLMISRSDGSIVDVWTTPEGDKVLEDLYIELNQEKATNVDIEQLQAGWTEGLKTVVEAIDCQKELDELRKEVKKLRQAENQRNMIASQTEGYNLRNRNFRFVQGQGPVGGF